MAIRIDTTAEEAPQLIFHIFELIVPILGQCLGEQLDLYLAGLQSIEENPGSPKYSKEAARIVRDLLPSVRDYRLKASKEPPTRPEWFQGVIDGRKPEAPPEPNK